MNALISTELPESTNGLHHLIFRHVGTEGQNRNGIGFHFDISSSCSSLIKNDKSFMFWNIGVPVNNHMRRKVINFPIPVLVTILNASKVVFLKGFMLTHPWDYFILEWSSCKNGSCIDDTPDFKFKRTIDKSFPEIVWVVFYLMNSKGIFNQKVYHFAVCSLDLVICIYFEVKVFRENPVGIFCSWKSYVISGFCQIPTWRSYWFRKLQ